MPTLLTWHTLPPRCHSVHLNSYMFCARYLQFRDPIAGEAIDVSLLQPPLPILWVRACQTKSRTRTLYLSPFVLRSVSPYYSPVFLQASEELILYEDELHDNGVCRLSLKMA
jgi:hypothetical protein